jgi:hypothetical protein
VRALVAAAAQVWEQAAVVGVHCAPPSVANGGNGVSRLTTGGATRVPRAPAGS